LKKEICRPNTQESSLLDMSRTILSALQQAKFLPAYLTKDSIKITMRSDGSYRVFIDDVNEQQSQYFVKCFRELMEPVRNQPYLLPKYEYSFPNPRKKDSPSSEPEQEEQTDSRFPTAEDPDSEERFFKSYLKGRAEPRVAAYYPVPSLLARSEKGREAFQAAWNKYVSPGFIVATETKPELLNRYFGMGASLAQRMLWE
jgi:hypothetical protein